MRTTLGIILFCWLAWPGIPRNIDAADFLNLDVAARPEALAAGVADDSASDSLSRNPAGLFGQSQASLAFTHFTAFDEFTYEQLEGFYPDLLAGNWAARLLYASSAPFAELDANGEEVGTVNYHDLLLHLAYARGFGSLQAGLGVKIFESQLAEFHSLGAAVDAGVRYQTAWRPLAIGLAVQNLGSRSAFENTADSLPQTAQAGVSLAFPLGTGQEVTLFADYLASLTAGEDSRPALGIEYGLYRVLFLRAGYRVENELGAVSLGAGVRLAGWGLDYAYQPFAYLGAGHHVTLTYAFPTPTPLTGAEAKIRDLATSPSEADTGEPTSPVTVRPLDSARIKELTVLPRNYESSMVYKTPALEPRVKEWTFEIRDESGRLIRSLAGHTRPPAYIQWDGRDQTGQAVPQNTRYQFVFRTPAKKAEVKTLPAFQPVLKFHFENNESSLTAVSFRLKTRPPVGPWSLEIRDSQSNQVVRTLRGDQGLPETILWDGRDEKKNPADTRRAYQYLLTVTYPDQSQLGLAGRMVSIPARAIGASQGQADVLIPGILFNFNSAQLRPEMTDKIMAAAGFLQDHPRARAVCEGHADEVGGVEYNQKLSLLRATMVARFLAKQPCVSAGAIEAKGFGKLKPENRLNTETGRERNRRVEIRLVFTEESR